MLAELRIQNFAIIQDLTLAFSDGLVVLTGETGAGKSIVVDSINLVLGVRADWLSRVAASSTLWARVLREE